MLTGRKFSIVTLVGVLAGLGVIFVFPYPQISAAIAEDSMVHWCGLFVKDSTGSPVSNIAVKLTTYGDYTYTTDAQGYTGRIWSVGLTGGCPGGIHGVEIPATVLYHNTEYAIYLLAEKNVTLTLRPI